MIRDGRFNFKWAMAMEAAAAGLPLFSLNPGSKVPARKGWQSLATSDRRKIRRMLRSHPDHDLGIATGRGLVVVDLDGLAGEESWAYLTQKHGLLPRTATCLTGGWGWHLYFWVMLGILVPNRVALWPGIDVRGEGGLATAPGSTHANGNLYRWVNLPSAGIAEMPPWLLKLILAGNGPQGGPRLPVATTGRTGDVAVVVDDLVRRFPVNGPGERNDRMNRAIGRVLGQGYDPDFILKVIDTWHERFLGVYRTGIVVARSEAEVCLRSKIGSPTFGIAIGAVEDHQTACKAIKLSSEALAYIRPQPFPEPGQTLNAKRVTPLNGCLCQSDDEFAFVEALLVHAIHKLKLGEFSTSSPDSRLVMTRDQVRSIAKDRHGIEWDNKQFERLKLRYISRPKDGKPATRFELLSEVLKGYRQPGGPAGVPSEYVASGVRDLLAMV